MKSKQSNIPALLLNWRKRNVRNSSKGYCSHTISIDFLFMIKNRNFGDKTRHHRLVSWKFPFLVASVSVSVPKCPWITLVFDTGLVNWSRNRNFLVYKSRHITGCIFILQNTTKVERDSASSGYVSFKAKWKFHPELISCLYQFYSKTKSSSGVKSA